MSLRVVWKDKELLLFPIISGFLTILVLASFFGIWLFYLGPNFGNLTFDLWFVVRLYLFYLIAAFITTFFNVALVSCAMLRLEGQDPSLAYGIRSAIVRIRPIMKWALFAATVGVVLQMIGFLGGAVGKLISILGGVGWAIATYFIIPILAFDGLGPIQALKRSGGIFRKTWGEATVSSLGLGAFFGLLLLAGLIPLFVFIILGNIELMIVAFAAYFVYAVVLLILSSAAWQVLLTALYLYAGRGILSKDFPEKLIKDPWGYADGWRELD